MDAHDSPDRASGSRQPHDTSFLSYDREDPHAPHYNWVQICLISAMGLAVGVMGTAAYVIWFSRDQQAYTDAMQAARRPPQMSAAGIPNAESAVPSRAALPTSSVTGRITPAAPTTQPRDMQANGALASVRGAGDAINPADTIDPDETVDATDDPQATAQAAAGGASVHADRGKQTAAASHHAAQRAKSKPTFVSRITAMFRKVAYHRGRERNNPPDPYSHP